MIFFKENVGYERDVSHCEPSQYIKIVTIKNITPADNSDNMDRIEFEEIGWETLSFRGLHEKGKKVIFIPAESVLPFDLSEELKITRYLSRGKVKSIRLRGNRSEGIILNIEAVKKWIPYIMKWEDMPTIHMCGDGLSLKNTSPYFHKFYKMPNILGEPYTFKKGENIFYSEKIHGINVRFGILEHPETGELTLYVGSHNTVLEESEGNIYWDIVKKYVTDSLMSGVVFFGEIFGPRIQNLHYDRCKPELIIFGIKNKDSYIDAITVKDICLQSKLPVINFRKTIYESLEQLRLLANEPSEYANSHIREGIVIVSKDRPNIMAKCMNSEYLERKNTERH